ncbi:MAG: xanthine dehydrogenase family protein molybdopterin-binding subunit [Bryobacterales bacterium]|nr:xanthine dehydrogenase family protein molybdopterin-binding subunit [Bryobacterales bacterium]
MAINYDWPSQSETKILGKRFNRLDGPWKVRGTAEYAYDRNLDGMLVARLVTCPHAHAKITAIDIEPAKRVKGFRAAEIITPVGTELQWTHQEVLAIAADTEEAARDCALAVKVSYEVLPHWMGDEDVKKAGAHNRVQPAEDKEDGDVVKGFEEAEVTHEGYYGLAMITHCCLEPHGQVVDWKENGEIWVYASTQAVSRISADLAKSLTEDERFKDVKANQIRCITPVMGGGFGSKFNIDTWGVACAKLSKVTGKPVKLMLDRREELAVAGSRPSDFGHIKVGAKKDGTLTAFEAETWSTGGVAGRGAPPLPYIFQDIPNRKTRHLNVSTNTGPARAWRAPNHPQAAALTMTALTDLAAKLDMDPFELFKKNLGFTPRAEVYSAEMDKAAELFGWKQKFHKPGDGKGHIKRGVGMSIHTWAGRPHDSTCRVSIEPDGSVTAGLASQDLGVGNRTVIAAVLAETVGLPLADVKVEIGDSVLPPSGASGGSTTVGGVTASTRRAAIHALRKLAEVVAPDLGVAADDITVADGKVFAASDTSKSLSWKDACRKLGTKTISEMGAQPARDQGKLNDSGVGGVQMAEVSVDTETGIVKCEKMVAVQDVGYVVALEQAESQVYGALIQGIAWALFEERVYDQMTGAYLNADMEFYKLSGIGDIGELVVHMVQGPYDDRGVIGLGEPPAISPGAALSNAVQNALGVRVPTMPMTADRVLAAIEKGGLS